jgi:hypothetical protein
MCPRVAKRPRLWQSGLVSRTELSRWPSGLRKNARGEAQEEIRRKIGRFWGGNERGLARRRMLKGDPRQKFAEGKGEGSSRSPKSWGTGGSHRTRGRKDGSFEGPVCRKIGRRDGQRGQIETGRTHGTPLSPNLGERGKAPRFWQFARTGEEVKNFLSLLLGNPLRGYPFILR